MPTLDWIGKRAVVNHHRELPYRLLNCDDSLSAGAADAGNLLVEGDNLHALKALLPYYAGRVKCIYIDPPYNTGNEGWVYNDNVNAPEIQKWLGDTVGKEAEDLSRHDKWLCMMYPRLALLREFLTEDGTIFISIDDNEMQNLRGAMDEIYGSQNFLGTIIWEKSDSPRMDAQFFSNRHDYIVSYARNSTRARLNRIGIGDDPAAHYDQIDEAGRRFYLKPLRAMGGQGDSRATRPTLYFPLTAPDGSEVYPKKQDGTDGAWRWRKEKIEDEIARIEWKSGRNGWTPYFRIYADTSNGRPAETIWFHSEVGSNRTSKAELKRILAELSAFATPKPVDLLKRIIRIATNPGDFLLDSFAGSGTTGNAVLALNKEDEGNRRFILCEMEPKIAREITAERLRRVIAGYGETPGLGGGFRFCTLGEPMLDAEARFHPDVKWRDLGHHLWFAETGEPWSAERASEPGGQSLATGGPMLGIAPDGRAIYLLHTTTLGDENGRNANTLTPETLAQFAPHDGPRTVYGEACTLRATTLSRERIIFKQIPYQVRQQ